MLLAVDIGNTNITLALVADGTIVTTRRAATPRARDAPTSSRSCWPA